MPSLTPDQQALAERHRPLALYVLRRYFGAYRFDRQLYSELARAAEMGLVLAAIRYKRIRRIAKRNNKVLLRNGKPFYRVVQFSTFAFPTIRGTICNEIRTIYRQQARQPHQFEEEPFGFDLIDHRERDPYDTITSVDHKAVIAHALTFFAPTDQLIIKLSFGLDGHPQLFKDQIAITLGISRTRVRQRYNRIMPRLRRLCEVLVV